MNHLGFWRSLIGTCRGVAIFDTLKNHSWGRIIWHTMLMAFFAGIAVTSGEYARVAPQAAELADRFAKTFGDQLVFNASGVRPSDDPGTGRRMMLPMGGLLAYVGQSEKGPELQESDAVSAPYIFVWSGDRYGGATRTPDDRWLTATGDMDGDSADLEPEQLSTEKMLKKLNDVHWDNPGKKESSFKVQISTLERSGVAISTAMIAIANFANILFLPWLYTALFALVFKLVGARRLKVLGFGQFWKIGLYAGFPATIIAGCFPAFDLPWLSYSTVYLLAMVIYWMIIIGRIEMNVANGGGNAA